jgi:hypothetical protein
LASEGKEGHEVGEPQFLENIREKFEARRKSARRQKSEEQQKRQELEKTTFFGFFGRGLGPAGGGLAGGLCGLGARLILKRRHGEVFLAVPALGYLSQKVVVHLVNLAAMSAPGLDFHAENSRKIINTPPYFIIAYFNFPRQ